MMELVSRNVSLKPSQRRQINAWLKRSLRLGQQVGSFVMTITIKRTGKMYEVRANVQDQAGTFTCRSRQHGVLDACRRLVHSLNTNLHNQLLQRMAA
jgi:hypothetical protein